MEPEIGAVNVLSSKHPGFEHLHLAHAGVQHRLDERVVVQCRVEAVADANELLKIEYLLFVSIDDEFMFLKGYDPFTGWSIIHIQFLQEYIEL